MPQKFFLLKKRFWLTALILIFFFFFPQRISGFAAEGYLERLLTRLFNMPVSIQGLKINLITGNVSCSRIRFMNQPQFSPGAHLDTALDAHVHFLEFFKKHVFIDKIVLKKAYYYIESVPNGKDSTHSNVMTWWNYMEGEDDPPPPPGAPPGEPTKWWVTLPWIEVRDSTFLYFGIRPDGSRKRFLFQSMNGYLKGFEWRTPDPAKLIQEVKVKGVFGDSKAPFWIEGRSNFATSQISFDLKGEIQDGAVTEYQMFLEGLPIKVSGGTYDLRSHSICVKRQLTSYNDLTLKKLQVTPGGAPTDLIGGLPLTGWVNFLKTQEKIHLKVKVKGDIRDPKFGFTEAFRKAFQRALVLHAKTGVKVLNPIQIVTTTGEIVSETPVKVVEGIAKIPDLFKHIPPATLNGPISLFEKLTQKLKKDPAKSKAAQGG